MYSKPQLLKKYLRYLFTASNGKGYGIHSPFVFDFVKNALNNKQDFPAYTQIENLRRRLLKDRTVIEVEDFGAGSAVAKTKHRSISEIAHHAAKPKKYGQLLYRIVDYYQPATLIELGTSLGLSTAYIASPGQGKKVFTFEGSSSIASFAENNFRLLGLSNILVTKGNFDETLGNILETSGTVDFVFVDGNHRKEPTLRYFDQLLDKANEYSIFIFDDIHWSADMEDAWEEIKRHPSVLLSIDLFFIGLVFFRKDFKFKQHFVIRF
jgi:predicted O-methyltransferase YrrM